jgi:adenylate cyclase
VATSDDLSSEILGVFGTTFSERSGRQVPWSASVSLSGGAVQIEAAFLYADLAGSGRIAAACPWSTTAKIIRAYLGVSTRLIRSRGGEIRSFDGDRVMGIFFGESMCSDAADCAREIDWVTHQLIDRKARSQFASIRNNGLSVQQACGVDVGLVRAVRAGIRNNNDLIWVGRAPSLAAKLSDLRESPYSTFISDAVYRRLRASSRQPAGQDIWEARTFEFAGEQVDLWRTQWMQKP